MILKKILKVIGSERVDWTHNIIAAVFQYIQGILLLLLLRCCEARE
jgi:hypothetical protein